VKKPLFISISNVCVEFFRDKIDYTNYRLSTYIILRNEDNPKQNHAVEWILELDLSGFSFRVLGDWTMVNNGYCGVLH
jgi:hypothetical protein